MRESKVSSRYARSLVDMAIANNKMPQIKEDMDLVLQTIDDSRELENLFSSPVINSGTKSTVAKKIFEGKVSKEVFDFINLVISKKREALLLSISYAFQEQYNALNDIVTVAVTTAQNITNDTQNIIKTDLEKKLNKKIIIQFKVDPEIIGGIIIHFSDKLYDASIAHQLQQVKNELINSYISKN
ncbi:MAG: ATP synthase F1 subunit delta [Bacteroidetes bacterium]|nr:ATP synthase F1 subunit delta [Bacteroidota bacterium]